MCGTTRIAPIESENVLRQTRPSCSRSLLLNYSWSTYICCAVSFESCVTGLSLLLLRGEGGCSRFPASTSGRPDLGRGGVWGSTKYPLVCCAPVSMSTSSRDGWGGVNAQLGRVSATTGTHCAEMGASEPVAVFPQKTQMNSCYTNLPAPLRRRLGKNCIPSQGSIVFA